MQVTNLFPVLCIDSSIVACVLVSVELPSDESIYNISDLPRVWYWYLTYQFRAQNFLPNYALNGGAPISFQNSSIP